MVSLPSLGVRVGRGGLGLVPEPRNLLWREEGPGGGWREQRRDPAETVGTTDLSRFEWRSEAPPPLTGSAGGVERGFTEPLVPLVPHTRVLRGGGSPSEPGRDTSGSPGFGNLYVPLTKVPTSTDYHRHYDGDRGRNNFVSESFDG